MDGCNPIICQGTRAPFVQQQNTHALQVHAALGFKTGSHCGYKACEQCLGECKKKGVEVCERRIYNSQGWNPIALAQVPQGGPKNKKNNHKNSYLVQNMDFLEAFSDIFTVKYTTSCCKVNENML